MPDVLFVEPDALAALESVLTTAKKGIDKELADLESQVRTLRSRWNGDARTAYDEAHRRWSETMTELSAIVDASSKLVADAAQRYEEAERANVQRWTIG
jgi:6 kDa early secretory antigenic target